jgi:hypothetical protein
MFGFDPSKMDPQALARMSQLIQGLGPEKLNRLQSLMHNMMAGFDVKKDLESFEQSLPPGFREELMQLMVRPASQASAPVNVPSEVVVATPETLSESMDEREARLTILRAVASGRMSPEEAEPLLRS